MTETPKVFISYSWTTPKHEDWVINLAERLVSDGIDVIIDKWNLKEGQDKYDFMETMVKSPEIQKVLIILDKKYSEKAELRAGGVGTETQIISPKIYGDVSQEKFVPIVAEKDESGNAYVPTFLESRIYIDLYDEDKFEENYEALLRNIYQRPAYSKPKIGKAPSYLFEETPMTHKTSIIIRSFDNQMLKSPKRINSILREFLDVFFEDLKGYSVNFSGSRDAMVLGKVIHDNIISYTPLRNDFINFLDKLFKSELDFDVDIFIKFFEKLPILKSPQDDRSSWTAAEFENYRFFIHEIFIYTIAVALKNEKYKFIEEIFYSGYFFQSRHDYKVEAQRFDKLYNYVEIFDQFYQHTYSQNYFSPMADLIVKRLPETLKLDEIVNADLLIHYIASLESLRWFPITYIYNTIDSGKFEVFNRLVSVRHFEKVKAIFNVSSIKELQEKLLAAQQNNKSPDGFGYINSFDRVIPIYDLIEINKIGTIR
ncbi:toll/interleukin-1 receptor domain-containing protein [Chryseobacterium salviniae]|uniref:SEFIR domain-containing protein n=1 Tax=Chryseobacterium salviniae TaxID=3101750 RepID=A0ABU6HS79_9FLAO|nr:SEFIR domain-containing protein [Chryseobacterium sp. T9W2-O]MEC3875758.1 SEFIR domain-containing protein [Chryseobacterium sp. T9W2-O]